MSYLTDWIAACCADRDLRVGVGFILAVSVLVLASERGES